MLEFLCFLTVHAVTTSVSLSVSTTENTRNTPLELGECLKYVYAYKNKIKFTSHVSHPANLSLLFAIV